MGTYYHFDDNDVFWCFDSSRAHQGRTFLLVGRDGRPARWPYATDHFLDPHRCFPTMEAAVHDQLARKRAEAARLAAVADDALRAAQLLLNYAARIEATPTLPIKELP